MVRVLCIVQARLTSSRLPKKVLMPLGNSGLSILEHVYQRLNMSKHIDKVVFAIPDSQMNDSLAEFLEVKQMPYTRGSENDVLDRFYQCAVQFDPQIVVRATCDNPLVDWELADKLIEKLENNDYVGSKDTPLGTGVEVFTMEALRKSFANATTEPQHEHVTPYMYQNMRHSYISYNGFHFRLTIDEERDYYVMDTIYRELYKGQPIPNVEVYDYLDKNPDIALYNQVVHQKQLGE